MKQFFSGIMSYWGSDTPQEVIWALNDLLDWAKTRGFQTNLVFDVVNAYDEPKQTQVYNDNQTLIEELTKFFEEKI
jgi:hypothetical protein